jgi:hypothetical protein
LLLLFTLLYHKVATFIGALEPDLVCFAPGSLHIVILVLVVVHEVEIVS